MIELAVFENAHVSVRYWSAKPTCVHTIRHFGWRNSQVEDLGGRPGPVLG
jgi:hypothetical protein